MNTTGVADQASIEDGKGGKCPLISTPPNYLYTGETLFICAPRPPTTTAPPTTMAPPPAPTPAPASPVVPVVAGLASAVACAFGVLFFARRRKSKSARHA
jgi:hypothetical protein